MPFYERGAVRIHYEEVGSGFPLLVTPGGGLNSKAANWPTAVFDAMTVFASEFRCITMDQRNAVGGQSTGPMEVERPWDAFADNQLGLMDHLGIGAFLYMGYCIGGSFAMKLIERAPERVRAAVLCQTIGHRPEKPDVMWDSGLSGWAPDFMARNPGVGEDEVRAYLDALYRRPADFLYSVSREFVAACQTPLFVMPDETASHPLQTSLDVIALSPRCEAVGFPWRDPAETKLAAIEQVRGFLKRHAEA